MTLECECLHLPLCNEQAIARASDIKNILRRLHDLQKRFLLEHDPASVRLDSRSEEPVYWQLRAKTHYWGKARRSALLAPARPSGKFLVKNK